jgi:hypothetical protein
MPTSATEEQLTFFSTSSRDTPVMLQSQPQLVIMCSEKKSTTARSVRVERVPASWMKLGGRTVTEPSFLKALET